MSLRRSDVTPSTDYLVTLREKDGVQYYDKPKDKKKLEPKVEKKVGLLDTLLELFLK